MTVRAYLFTGWLSVVWLMIGNIVSADDPEVALNDSELVADVRVQTKDGWSVIESPNFRCRCQLNEADGRRLAQCCETWRVRLRKAWLTQSDSECWQPKCEVCLHPNLEAYNRALGRPGDTSVGSTTINFDQGRAVLRRIDIRIDARDWSNAALPHELTHVTLAERFGGRTLPRWADEGIAMLSESPEKHRERLTNLQETLVRHPTYRMFDLVKTVRVPPAHLRDAFYGQSVAVVSLLVRKSTPAKFADFVAESERVGLDQALREHYRVDGIAGLQREWDESIRRPEAIEFVSLQLHTDKGASVAILSDR